jgi:hypothetical protein
MEWKLFDGDKSIWASPKRYMTQEAFHYAEQKNQMLRIITSFVYVLECVKLGASTAVDLGCGDGYMLSLLKKKILNLGDTI